MQFRGTLAEWRGVRLSIQCAAFAFGVGLGLASPQGPSVELAALTACAIGACVLVRAAQDPRVVQRATFLLVLALGSYLLPVQESILPLLMTTRRPS